MTTPSADRGNTGFSRHWDLVRSELAPFPGRLDAVWRYLLVTALVIVISMTLEVPVLGLSLVIVFFTAMENTTLTLDVALMNVAGATFAIGTSILLMKFTMGYPLLRITAGFALLFGYTYFTRIHKLGHIAWVGSMGISYTLILLDVVDNPEAMTRLLLWVWVAILYPILVTALVNQILLPPHPVRLLKEELLRQLDEIDQQLEARRAGTPAPALSLDRLEKGIRVLHRHLSFAIRADQDCRRERGMQLIRINTIDRLRTAAMQLSRLPANAPAPLDRIGQVQRACRDLRQAITDRGTFTVDPSLVSDVRAEDPIGVALQEMAHALNALAEAESVPLPPRTEGSGRMLAADWLSNPVYAQFALKTTLAAFACYVFQSATQWQGIHTAVLTCFIVALPNLGASSHKGILRIAGCAAGSLVTLFITVFLIPRLDTITGLLLLTLPIVAIGAWIMAGSERFRYIGLQFVFAFSLALFGKFYPNHNIPEIRDRMVGIMLGVLVTIGLSTFLWPEREGSGLWGMLAQLVRSIAGLARAGRGRPNEMEKVHEIGQARQRGWSLLAANREMESRVALEPGWQYDRDAVTLDLQTWFAQVQETLFSINWLQTLLHHLGEAFPESFQRSCEQHLEDVAERLDRLADHLDHPSRDFKPESLSASLAAFDRHLLHARTSGADPRRLDEIGSAVQAIHERIAQLGSHISQAAMQPSGPQ